MAVVLLNLSLHVATNTQAIVATNSFDQTEGIEDSIIVVAFRGSVDAANIRTDLKSGMVSDPMCAWC